MRTALTIALIPILCACGAMDHMPHFPSTAVGRVLSASEPSRYEYQKAVPTPIVVGKTLMVGSSVVTVAGSTRVYTLRLQDGMIITATSESEFQPGSCIELRHGSDLAFVTSSASHVNGRLFPSTRC